MNNMTDNKDLQSSSISSDVSGVSDETVVKLSAMELNGIKLDPKHTLLTPNYLEKI